ncbi:MAG: hypothetical protein GU362_02185 [Thaumarchaeota archaeon]|jgi:vacuolar-type H+-ATPase subunit E/Vma4|nr:hypothetical protein [Nitrososphaerota archaeon]
MESIRSIIEREKNMALETLSRALDDSLKIIEDKKNEAFKEGQKIIEEAKKSSEKERLIRTSQQELEGKRILSTKEDELLEKLISEAYKEFLESDNYGIILEKMFSKGLKDMGGSFEVYAGKLDQEKLTMIARKYGIEVSGVTDFERGFSFKKGDESITYDLDRMLNDIKRELKRMIINKVNEIENKR